MIQTEETSELKIDPQRVSQGLMDFLRTSVAQAGWEGVVLGLSGGLDSAVVLYLAAGALGPERVLALIMPEHDSSEENEADANNLAQGCGVRTKRVELTPILTRLGIYQHIPKVAFAPKRLAGRVVRKGYELYSGISGETAFLRGLGGTSFGLLRRANAYYRMKHRLRMVVLYSHAERENLLVAGTANKSEFLTGFFVKYGDGAADIMPLLPLYKTQVQQLARYLGVPEKILKKAPSPDLLPGITDEFALGLSYEKLDLILHGLERGRGPGEIAAEVGLGEEKVHYVQELMRRSEPMRAPPLAPAAQDL